MTNITAWLSIGSTYTYLTALRIKGVCADNDIALEIKPISIRQIMKSMDNIPFPPSKKTKVDYMWRDIERRAAFYGLPVPESRAPYPLQEFDRANLVGIVMNNQGRYLDYFEATYRCWFLDGLEAGGDDNLAKVFGHLGMPLDEVLQAAAADEVQAAYAQTTAEAQDKGIFGAPSFSVGDEIFWGDDRLEDAIRFAKNG